MISYVKVMIICNVRYYIYCEPGFQCTMSKCHCDPTSAGDFQWRKNMDSSSACNSLFRRSQLYAIIVYIALFRWKCLWRTPPPRRSLLHSQRDFSDRYHWGHIFPSSSLFQPNAISLWSSYCIKLIQMVARLQLLNILVILGYLYSVSNAGFLIAALVPASCLVKQVIVILNPYLLKLIFGVQMILDGMGEPDIIRSSFSFLWSVDLLSSLSGYHFRKWKLRNHTVPWKFVSK